MPMSDLSDKAIGQWLRRYRLDAGLTAAQVGKILGKSDETVYNMEGGKTRVHHKYLYILLNLYGIDPDDAFKGDVPPASPSRRKGEGMTRLNRITEIYKSLPNKWQVWLMDCAKAAQAASQVKDLDAPAISEVE